MVSVPEVQRAWFNEPCMMGIDEAGRGPVLGPMVYGVAYTAISQREAMTKRAFADSKTLTEKKRDALLADIMADSAMGYAFDSLSAQTISAKMLQSEKVSLNTLAYDSTYKLIDDTLALGVNLTEIYVDTVGDADRYRERLCQRFPGIAFTVCPKADAIYPIVSAASIVAKVTRDAQLREFLVAEQIEVAREFGSGYPGDPVTQAWLTAHKEPIFGYPGLVRFSWQGTVRILAEHGADVQWACESDMEPGQQELSFGGAAKGAVQSSASCGAGRHSYMRTRKLQRVDVF